MTSIISEMLMKVIQKKKMEHISLYYMGVNAGAFLGIMLCGYIGEKISWSWGFGLAGIFMFFGMLQFYFSQNIFGEIGLKPTAESKADQKQKIQIQETHSKIRIANYCDMCCFRIAVDY